MTNDKTLTDAFASLEQGAPDADTEFAALMSRIDGLGRRRVRRAVAGGVGVMGVAAAVALGAAYLPGDGDAPHTGPTSSRSGPAMPQPHQVAFSTSMATTTGADGVQRPIVKVDAGWLPAGASVTSVSADRLTDGGGSERRWLVAYADDAHGEQGGYYISISRSSEHTLPDYEYPPKTSGTDITVQGHPARRFDVHMGAAVRRVIIAVDFGQGQIYEAELFYETARLNAQRAQDVIEQVAATMKVDRHDVLPVTARLTAAPAAARIVDAFAVFDDAVFDDHFSMTFYRLNDEDSGAQIGIGGLAEKYPAPIKGKAGRAVQGRPSVVIASKGRTILYIKGLFGEYTKLISGTGAESLDDLYQIADGIRATR